MRLIDADALIELLGIAHECENCSDKMQAFCDAHPDFGSTCELICEAPTVDAVKHGHWTAFRCATDADYAYRYRCNICGHFVNSGTDKNYCPNCGAKMDGDKDAAD